MNHSFFQFRGKIYNVEFGSSMGNPFSPLIAELFMASFEINLRERNMLPKSWLRYGDKVFAVISKDDVQKTFDVLNNQFQSIKFTCEPEYNGELPSLDLMKLMLVFITNQPGGCFSKTVFTRELFKNKYSLWINIPHLNKCSLFIHWKMRQFHTK